MTGARLLFALGALFCLVAAKPAPDSPARLAEAYVRLALSVGEKEPGFIDAYYGPPLWASQAKATAKRETLPALRQRAERLLKRADALIATEKTPLGQRRLAFLRIQLRAIATRLLMLEGGKLSFEDEAEGLFGVRPVLKPLTAYDPILAEIDRLLPGPGTLAERVDAYQNTLEIPKDRLRPVMEAAIAECRRRTIEHIKLPAGEHFDLSLVNGKPWSGYNYYQGNAHSRIEINTDFPVRVSRAVELGCHEGYPGHHVLNLLLEARLAKGRGWREFTVYPLYSPQSLIAEGTANYGIVLAFPGDERAAFEARTIYPLAGLDSREAGRLIALTTAAKALSGARFTVAADYLAGRMSPEDAKRALQRYQLASPERAAQSLAFIDKYRSYVINYGLGEEMARGAVERAGQDPAARWARLEAILSEPTIPSDLLP